ncbi:N-acetylmuramoyl-L-alanine amidase [Sideroxydans lithotrophicus]|uniref:N-acetylmuramoyl-L-alanine amidase AmiC n=1 Tax=Sideroxydans lithotrophicus (strain ES-1) TaxID=580332 RepID=D5CR30_SIDLE|nr:N-acetylmuramoyl-L-alanine amidase [Sideroxydans lithotrophicus]ADE11416.1 N-acetylmuramoyl-L-alanine amidase [Sideroxydans lithotrophicus ES-1]
MLERALRLTALLCLLWIHTAFAGIAVSAARIWPAQDYTRLTLESKQPILYNLFTLSNPERLVIDLEDIDITPALNELSGKIGKDDPYIKSVRVGRFKAGVVRLVLDLKAQVKPQLFSLQPVGDYGYRLVLDVYPLVAVDPLMQLAQQGETKLAASEPAAATSSVDAVPANPSLAMPSEPVAKPMPPARTEFSNRVLLIAVDAGHGGEDPGARGRRGTHEKDVTLAIARKLKAQIDDTPGMRAILIRDGDYFIPLGMRVEKARKAHADLFVSIHADAFVRSSAHGSSVFALSEHGATSASARWLAKKENEADLIGGVNLAVKDPYLARTLLDLSQTATITDSLKLARQVLRELGGVNSLHRGHVEQAGFAVLKSPDTPSILVETAFISNPKEELKLKDEGYQEKIAQAILGGLKHYFALNPALSKPRMAQSD